MRKAFGLIWFTLSVMTTASVHASDSPSGIRLLMSPPACVKHRLGRVAVSVGNREPNLRTGMAPGGVSYQRAFQKLAQAAAEKGGNAVVLREHQADYFTKAARRARRPTYVSLRGAVLVLDEQQRQCSMTLIDPSKFEQDAISNNGTMSLKTPVLAFRRRT